MNFDGFRHWCALERGIGKQSTIENHIVKLKYLVKNCGEPLTASNVKNLLLKLKNENKSVHRLNNLVLTSRVWGHFVGDSELQTIKKFNTNRYKLERRVIDEESIKKILHLPCDGASKKDALNLCLKILIVTGARPTEVLNLKREDVDNVNFYFMDTKTHDNRTVPISELIKPLVASWIAKTSGAYVFPSRTQKPFITDALSSHFRRVCDELGIDRQGGKITLYSLRNSKITRLVDRENPDWQAISALVGHKNVAQTIAYRQLGTQQVKKALENDPVTLEVLPRQKILEYFIAIAETFWKNQSRFSIESKKAEREYWLRVRW